MARQKIRPGGEIDVLTLDEARGLLSDFIRGLDVSKTQRVRASATFELDANGNGVEDVYKVPAGFQFEVRRVVVDADGANAPAADGEQLGIQKFMALLRSGTRIEFAQPEYDGVPQVPGVQTWGAQQGPYLRNDETLQVQLNGLDFRQITVTVEGILYKADAS